jgi:hypothetical protein
MDSTCNSTIFDEDGRCNYCKNAEILLRKNYYPNEIGARKLEETFNLIKFNCRNDEYDCLVGLSGGLDSAYVLYLGKKHGLRMLAVHIDDGLDTEEAKENISKLCKKTKIKLVNIKPDMNQYKDLLLSFFKASVPNLAIPQDNILQKSIYSIIKKYKFKYFLSGGNFAHESILETIPGNNISDKRHIKDIHNKFGKGRINKLNLLSMSEHFLNTTIFSKIIFVRPLNFINYTLEKALDELKDYADFIYYGGKHHENILTRFLQCYYLPKKFNYDKRKSHYSSLIVSGQLSREEGLKLIDKPLYLDEDALENDIKFLANYFELTYHEFLQILNFPPRQHIDYKQSFFLNYKKLGFKIKNHVRRNI